MTADLRPSITFSVPTRESATVKAARLLVQGRVSVRLVRAGRCWAVVNGDHGVYETGCSRSRWFCSCDCYGARCSHILAVQAITDLRGGDTMSDTRWTVDTIAVQALTLELGITGPILIQTNAPDVQTASYTGIHDGQHLVKLAPGIAPEYVNYAIAHELAHISQAELLGQARYAAFVSEERAKSAVEIDTPYEQDAMRRAQNIVTRHQLVTLDPRVDPQ